MAGASKKRAKAERNNGGNQTGGQSAATGEPISQTAPSSTVDVNPFDGPQDPSSSTAGAGADGRGRRMPNVPGHPGSGAESTAAGDKSKKFQELQINKNVDYPAAVYNLHSQSYPVLTLRTFVLRLLPIFYLITNMSGKSTSVAAPESEAPPAADPPAPSAPSAPTPSASAPVSTEASSSAAKPSKEPKPGVKIPAWKADKTKFRHLNVDTDRHEYDIPTELPARPGFNTSGQAVQVNINSFPITQFPDKTVYQYDVLIGSGVEKRGLIMAIWESKLMKAELGPGWVFDGNRLAWNLKQIPARQFTIDLDQEKGIVPRASSTRSNTHKIQIRQAAVVNLAAIQAYLAGKMPMDSSVLQAIDFLDHLLRVTPPKTMYAIKRSYFHHQIISREALGGAVEAMKGVYQSIRAAQGGRLIVNVDVSNSVFWIPMVMWASATQVTGVSATLDIHKAVQRVQASYNAPLKDSVTMIKLRKLKKVRFNVKYRGAPEATTKKTFVVKDFSMENAYTWKFDYKDRETGEESRMSIFDYFKKTYNIHLEWPTLPIVETARRNVAFPMEVCNVLPGQRFPYKCDEQQTAKMIKFAVTRPNERRRGIESGLEHLNWAGDNYLINYGVKISPKMLETQARLLAPPVVQFGKQTVKPGYSGRWRLDGQQFLLPNKDELHSWGVCVLNSMGRDQIDAPIAQNFIRTFINTYKSHGGKVGNCQPIIINGPPDIAVAVETLYGKLVNQYPQIKPQMMVFFCAGKDAYDYMRIKKSCDCRFGIVSQCMQTAHVRRCQGQYISNVLMKFNAKLGGTTARVPGPAANKGLGHFKRPTMVIGADVSHAAPGSLQPSMAALTVSMDTFGCRYAAACESNGHRVEIISQFNMEDMLAPLFREWMSTVGKGRMPQHIMYFRDGVSEGQYQHVLQQEILYIKRCWRKLEADERDHSISDAIKFTVTVCSKRHHIRFFPKERSAAADKNMNPHPGTLVERDVTHPFEYDFYLNSHSAIQGTARPTHYHVLLDEAKMPPNEFQNLIYEHCYQYMRSTTPVSIFPAVYYAHLASNRARSHENKPASSGPHQSDEVRQRAELIKLKALADMEGKKLSKVLDEKYNRFLSTEQLPLVKMKQDTSIRWSMWYI